MLKTQRRYFTDARDLFEQARSAARDADVIARQLARMEAEAESLGGGGFEPMVSKTTDPHRAQARMAARLDRRDVLERRQQEDYAMLELASRVLYGTDEATGLDALVPPWWADVLWWRYLDGRGWPEVAEAVGYSEQRCRQVCDVALDTVDSWGIVGTMEALPLNSPEVWERDARSREARKD